LLKIIVISIIATASTAGRGSVIVLVTTVPTITAASTLQPISTHLTIAHSHPYMYRYKREKSENSKEGGK